MECAICFEISEPFILTCNHSVCMDCYRNKDLKKCPFCRKDNINLLPNDLEFSYRVMKDKTT